MRRRFAEAGRRAFLWQALAVGELGVVLRTEDGGRTWQIQPNVTSNALQAIAFLGGSNLWVAGRGGSILRRTEALATVKTTSSPRVRPTLKINTKPKPRTPLIAITDDGDIPVAAALKKENKDGETGVVQEETRPCKIITNIETVSLLKDGGRFGVMIGYEDADDLTKLTATSSSPQDVEVVLEPEIGAGAGRAFYVIRSISRKTGAFTVTFEAPCGKKEITVRVR